MDYAPAIRFLTSVRDISRLARQRTKDTHEARIALDLEAEMAERISRLQAAAAEEEAGQQGGANPAPLTGAGAGGAR